jgi:Zn-dependent protease
MLKTRGIARPRGGEVGEPLSWIIALVALVIAIMGPSITYYKSLTNGYSIGIVVGFLVHESMHRYFARKAGMNASFVATGYGILITLISAVLPIKLLAPGYVRVWGYRINPLGAFKSVVAGPASNILLSIIFLFSALLASGGYRTWLLEVAEINAWLALFNLIPIGPLDGRKIFQFRPLMWLLLFLLSAAVYGACIHAF